MDLLLQGFPKTFHLMGLESEVFFSKTDYTVLAGSLIRDLPREPSILDWFYFLIVLIFG